LEDIGWNGSHGSPRVLIFTKYRATQDALASALSEHFGFEYSPKFNKQPEQVIAQINGSCPDVHLMKTVEAFATDSLTVSPTDGGMSIPGALSFSRIRIQNFVLFSN
jgi:hypothetical protein